jgi:cob(I)alamin adenosyltransferase
MTKFYTRMGDDGFTGLLGEGRVAKYHPRPEAIGELDEASAALGAARSLCQASQSGPLLLAVQRDIYHIMAEIAATGENAEKFRMIDAARVVWLEEQVDTISVMVEMPKEFILPGDSTAGAMLALARTVIRRAERRMAQLTHHEEVQNDELLRYLNRLSSLCFVLELLENQAAGKSKPTLAKAE